MKAEVTGRGFAVVTHEKYQNKRGEMTRLIQESSAIGDFLWVGQDHHLNREEVAELVSRLQHWLETGRLKVDETK